MKKYIITTLLILSSFWTFGQTQTFTLQQAIDYAVENSVNVKNAALNVKITDGQIKEIKASGLPQVNGQIQVTNNPKVQTSFIGDFISPVVYGVLNKENLSNSKAPESGVFPATFGTQFSSSAAVSVRQLVFDGSFFLGLKAARTYKELFTKALTQTKIDIATSVTTVYYAVLITKERLKLTNENISRIDTLLSQTQAMFDNGFAEKIEVSRIQLRYNNLKSQQKSLENGLDLSLELLKYQMGFPSSSKIDVAEKLDDMMPKNPLQIENSDFNYSDRIEYSIMETNVIADELQVKRYKVGYYPTVYANANLGYNAGSNDFGDIAKVGGDSWFQFSSIGLTVAIPIFDGFRKKHIIQQRKLKLQGTLNLKNALEQRIDYEQKQAKLTLKSSLYDLNQQAQNIALAKDIFKTVKIKYQNGVGSSLELVEAEGSLNEAENNYYNTLYATVLAKIALDKSLGKILK